MTHEISFLENFVDRLSASFVVVVPRCYPENQNHDIDRSSSSSSSSSGSNSNSSNTNEIDFPHIINYNASSHDPRVETESTIKDNNNNDDDDGDDYDETLTRQEAKLLMCLSSPWRYFRHHLRDGMEGSAGAGAGAGAGADTTTTVDSVKVYCSDSSSSSPSLSSQTSHTLPSPPTTTRTSTSANPRCYSASTKTTTNNDINNSKFDGNYLAHQQRQQRTAVFTFTCPSLSLLIDDLEDQHRHDATNSMWKDEATTTATTMIADRQKGTTTLSSSSSSKNRRVSMDHQSTNASATKSSSSSSSRATSTDGKTDAPILLLPSELLARCLRIEDIDATRLSADAMARNMGQSFQRAIDWRIRNWIATLCRQLHHYETTLVSSHNHHLSRQHCWDLLRSTDEAHLIQCLQTLLRRNSSSSSSCDSNYHHHHHQNPIMVLKATNCFRLLHEQVTVASDSDDESMFQQTSKRRRADSSHCHNDSMSINTTTTTTTTITHRLLFHCQIVLKTPVGNAEVSMEVPGTIQASLLGHLPISRLLFDEKKLHSIVLNIDTNILAAMLENAARKVVRSTLTLLLKPTQEIKSPNATFKSKDVSHLSPQFPLSSVLATSNEYQSHSSQAKDSDENCFTSCSVLPFVSPDATMQQTEIHKELDRSTKTGILPIPDDFCNDSDYTHRFSHQPRRMSLYAESSDSSSHDSRRRLNNSGSNHQVPPPPPPCTLFTPEEDCCDHQPPSWSTQIVSSVLVSPPPGRHSYADHSPSTSKRNFNTAPSLPVLVAVACRAISNDGHVS
jgi:hypothetical protein